MTRWDNIRRAKDNLRPHRSVNLLPSVLNTILDEIRELKRTVKELEHARYQYVSNGKLRKEKPVLPI